MLPKQLAGKVPEVKKALCAALGDKSLQPLIEQINGAHKTDKMAWLLVPGHGERYDYLYAPLTPAPKNLTVLAAALAVGAQKDRTVLSIALKALATEGKILPKEADEAIAFLACLRATPCPP